MGVYPDYAPPDLSRLERFQFSAWGEPMLRLLMDSKSPQYTRSDWFDVRILRSHAGGEPKLRGLPGDPDSPAYAEVFQRFKRTVGTIAVERDSLDEILSDYESAVPAAVVKFGNNIMAGVLRSGLEGLSLEPVSQSYELCLRTGRHDFQASIGGWLGHIRAVILPKDTYRVGSNRSIEELDMGEELT